MVDENGEKLGDMERDQAIAIAKERGLDLVLIAPQATPPVARILSWSKFKYEQSKKQRDNKGKKSELKEMWFKTNIAEGDIEHKLKKVKEFIAKGDRVKITVRGQGRITFADMRGTLDRVLNRTTEFAVTDGDAKSEGRNYTIYIKRK